MLCFSLYSWQCSELHIVFQTIPQSIRSLLLQPKAFNSFYNTYHLVTVEVYTAATMTITALWNVTPSDLVHRYQRFRRTCYRHLQHRRTASCGTEEADRTRLTNVVTPHSRIQQSSSSLLAFLIIVDMLGNSNCLLFPHATRSAQHRLKDNK
jgi:hypothetical protein